MRHTNLHILFIAILLSFAYGAHVVTLDTEKDLYLSWQLTEDADLVYYTENVTGLLKLPEFPDPSKLKLLQDAQGIWAILPDFFDENVTLISTEVRSSFVFTSIAQLMDSVSIRYCINKGAKILIRTMADDYPIYTISASESTQNEYEWIEMTIPFPRASSRFIIEAHVLEKEDFVLIDKIKGFYLESPTRPTRRPGPRTRKTTTIPSTTQKPKNSVSPIGNDNDLLLGLSLFFILV